MNRSFRAGAATGRTVTKEADEELALFLEMRKLEKERNNLLLHSAGELDPPLGSKPGTAPIFKIASSAPARKAGIDDFLNSDSEKNDYDWSLRDHKRFWGGRPFADGLARLSYNLGKTIEVCDIWYQSKTSTLRNI